MEKRTLAAIALLTILAACSARPATATRPAAPSPEPAAADVPPVMSAFDTTPTPLPPTLAQAAPPAQPAPPVTHTFALGGHGSVTVTTNGGSATITVTISGLAAVAHAVHLHSACNGSAADHIAAFGVVGSSGTVGLTVPAGVLGATVIVYPNSSATGPPILCGATA